MLRRLRTMIMLTMDDWRVPTAQSTVIRRMIAQAVRSIVLHVARSC